MKLSWTHCLAVMLLGLSTNTWACQHLIIGFDVGANVFSLEKTVSLDQPSGTPTVDTFQQSSPGVAGALEIGCNHQIGNFGIDIMWVGMLANSETRYTIHNWQDNGIAAGAKERLRGSWGFVIDPGYYVTKETKAYIRLGYTRGNFTAKPLYGSAADVGLSQSVDEWLNGYTVGAGINTEICDRTYMKFEYTFNHYQTVTRSAVEPHTTRLVTVHFHPIAHLIWVGFSRRFEI